jgi:hypothetical protein
LALSTFASVVAIVLVVPAGASASTLIVVENSIPDAPQGFMYSAGGGLSPTTFFLDDWPGGLAGSQTYLNVPPGSGYSISQFIPVSNWYLAKVGCDDGSPITNISLSAGETVTCTFVNGYLYPRPGSATPKKVPLVKKYKPCNNSNTSHAPPLSDPSCTPVDPESTLVTTGTGGVGSGSAKLGVIPGNPGTMTDEADLSIDVNVSDVRQPTNADYTGQLVLVERLRITDQANNVEGETFGSATVQDFDFAAPFSCTATPGAGGSNCSLNTTADTLVPNFVAEGKRMQVSTLAVSVLDMGLDGSITPGTGTCPPTCGTGDEAVFVDQGIFLP